MTINIKMDSSILKVPGMVFLFIIYTILHFNALVMTKKLSFIADDGITYHVSVTSIPFEDNGVNRLRFKVEHMLSGSVVQRMADGNWSLIEGEIKIEHVPLVGEEIRLNFET